MLSRQKIMELMAEGMFDVTVASTPALTNSVAPVATGVGYVGETLSVTDGTWNETPDSYTYQWYNGVGAVAGATSSTYVVVIATEGTALYCEVTAIKAGYTNGTADSNTLHHWVPSDISTSFYVDSIDTSTITESADRVSDWNDKSGNDHHLQQLSGALKPWHRDSDTIGGKQAMSFNGQRILNTRNIVSQAFSIAYLLEWGTTANGYSLSYGSAADDIRTYSWVTKTYVDAGSAMAGVTLDTNPHVLVVNFDGASTEMIRDGGTPVTGNPGSAGYSGGICLGGHYTNAWYWSGKLGEVVISSGGVWSAANRAKVEGFLMWRRGLEGSLAAGHTYESAPPEGP